MAQPACIDYAEPSSGQLSLAQALRAERPATLQKKGHICNNNCTSKGYSSVDSKSPSKSKSNSRSQRNSKTDSNIILIVIANVVVTEIVRVRVTLLLA